MTKKLFSQCSAILILSVFALAGCGQKGPLIIEPRPSLEDTTQEGLPNEISPADGSESEPEAETEAPQEAQEPEAE